MTGYNKGRKEIELMLWLPAKAPWKVYKKTSYSALAVSMTSAGLNHEVMGV
jgi:hypothetical protein